MKKKNLIFDVGNVLLEYRWNQMLLDYGLSEEEAKVAGPLFFDHPNWKELDLGVLSVEEVICLYEKDLPQYAGLIRWFLTNLDLMPIPRKDVWEKVHALKEKGYKIAVLTNKPQATTEKVCNIYLKEIGFDLVYGQKEGRAKKPDKASTLEIIEKLNLSKENVIFVGDGDADYLTAKNAGVKSVSVLWGYRTKEQLYSLGAKNFVNSPSELLDFLINN